MTMDARWGGLCTEAFSPNASGIEYHLTGEESALLKLISGRETYISDSPHFLFGISSQAMRTSVWGKELCPIFSRVDGVVFYRLYWVQILHASGTILICTQTPCYKFPSNEIKMSAVT